MAVLISEKRAPCFCFLFSLSRLTLYRTITRSSSWLLHLKKESLFSLTDKVKIIEAYDLEMKKSGKVCMTKFSEQTGISIFAANRLILKIF